MKRIGIYGGSFDPVHLGHLLVAFAAQEEMKLDRLIFVPANLSPLKQDAEPVSPDLRLRMLRLALAGLEWATVDDLEIRRGGVSYSVDTVRALAGKFPESSMFLLIGEDNVPTLMKWRDAPALMKMVEFLVIPRPGESPQAAVPTANMHRLRGWPVQVSSSQIRQRVRQGLPIDHLVPVPVAEVIQNYRLYLA